MDSPLAKKKKKLLWETIRNRRNKGREKREDVAKIKSIRVWATMLLRNDDEGVCRHTDIRVRYV